MKYRLLLISSLLLQTSVNADWWNSAMNPMGFMQQMPRNMNDMNRVPFSNMDPLSMMPDPQIPQVQFTPPNVYDARNMGNILQNIGQDMPGTMNSMPNTFYDAAQGKGMRNINPWNPQQPRTVYPSQHQARPNIWQQQSAPQTYVPAVNASSKSNQHKQTSAQSLNNYGKPNGRGSYHGDGWTPFKNTPPQLSNTIPARATSSYQPTPAYQVNPSPGNTAVTIVGSKAPKQGIAPQPPQGRPMPTQPNSSTYRGLFD